MDATNIWGVSPVKENVSAEADAALSKVALMTEVENNHAGKRLFEELAHRGKGCVSIGYSWLMMKAPFF